MQTMLQLNPPIPMQTPKGDGLAVMVIDYGPDYDLLWTIAISKGEHAGEIWTYANPHVRAVENVTLGRHVSVPDARSSNGYPGKMTVPQGPIPARLGMGDKPANGRRLDAMTSRLPGADG